MRMSVHSGHRRSLLTLTALAAIGFACADGEQAPEARGTPATAAPAERAARRVVPSDRGRMDRLERPSASPRVPAGSRREMAQAAPCGGGARASSGAAPPREPGADAAVAVICRYYAAIDAGQLEAAYRLWTDGGAASGQTLPAFMRGFAETRHVSVEPGSPGRIDRKSVV